MHKGQNLYLKKNLKQIKCMFLIDACLGLWPSCNELTNRCLKPKQESTNMLNKMNVGQKLLQKDFFT